MILDRVGNPVEKGFSSFLDSRTFRFVKDGTDSQSSRHSRFTFGRIAEKGGVQKRNKSYGNPTYIRMLYEHFGS